MTEKKLTKGLQRIAEENKEAKQSKPEEAHDSTNKLSKVALTLDADTKQQLNKVIESNDGSEQQLKMQIFTTILAANGNILKDGFMGKSDLRSLYEWVTEQTAIAYKKFDSLS